MPLFDNIDAESESDHTEAYMDIALISPDISHDLLRCSDIFLQVSGYTPGAEEKKAFVVRTIELTVVLLSRICETKISFIDTKPGCCQLFLLL